MLEAARLASTNPASGERLAEYDVMRPEEVDDAVRRAHEAFRVWRTIEADRRGVPMRELARLLLRGAEEHARLMAVEMGKPVAQGMLEIEKCAWAAEHFAEHAAALLEPERVATGAARSYVAFDPLGVILGVMPWNFPYWQVFRFAVPTLMAGNAVVVKHASNVTGCALAIEDLFAAAGFPDDLYRALRVGADAVERVLAHPLVRGVSLTGSAAAGKDVAASAGGRAKKTVLELGGSDAYLILEDADLAAAARIAADARLINAGQSCVAAKRFVVVEARREDFEGRFVAELRARRVGDPTDPTTEVGPLARHDLRDALHRQVVESLRRGARLLLGGSALPGPGAYYAPTALAGVGRGMPAYGEELFGPVAALITAADEREAVRIANDSAYGLGAAVFTRDLERGERIARELEAGVCVVNGQVQSDPRLPFGGVKESGYGRELSSYGLKEFVNIKSVFLY